VQEASDLIKRRIVILRASDEREIHSAFDSLAKDGGCAIAIAQTPSFGRHRKMLVELAAQFNLNSPPFTVGAATSKRAD